MEQMQRLEREVWWMSRQAIAAVLARNDLASGERLVALSLASFAGRENRAWPGAPAASARAGLSRSRYQQAREQLIAQGLVAVDERATGRGRASTVTLLFADTGPWWDGEINVELFEAVLSYSRVRGPERLLLATMAAIADSGGEVGDLSTEQLCAAAGIADRTYRRARGALLASGELQLVSGVGGRGNTNVWILRDPRTSGALPALAPRRVAPPAGARPLVASADKGGHGRTVAAENCPTLAGVSEAKGGQDRTVPPEKCPVVTGVSAEGGHARTLFGPAGGESPAETPAETPAPNARVGREPLNPRTGEHPPIPPGGGSSPSSILVEETYVTPRGRTRRRAVRVDLDEVRRSFGLPGLTDRNDWEQIRDRLRELVGESMFEIWLDPVELIAVDPSGALVLDAPQATFSWLQHRYGRAVARCASDVSRSVRFAEEAERQALAEGSRASSSPVRAVHTNQREVS
jgi:DnaA N-terminal domain